MGRSWFQVHKLSKLLTKGWGLILATTLLSLSLLTVKSSAEPDPTPGPDGSVATDTPLGPVPSTVQEEVLIIGDPLARRPIDLFLDFLDPKCGTLIRQVGEELSRQIESRNTVVNVRLVSYLDPYSASSSYSSRAMIATYLVAGESATAEISWKYIRMLFEENIQPHQGALRDLSDQQLADIARQAGAPDSVVEFIASGEDRANVDSHQIHIRNMGVLAALNAQGTPTATYGGKPFALDALGLWVKKLAGTQSSTSAPSATDPQSTPTSSAIPLETRGYATGVNVPHQEIAPGTNVTRPSETLPAPLPSSVPLPSPSPPSEEQESESLEDQGENSSSKAEQENDDPTESASQDIHE